MPLGIYDPEDEPITVTDSGLPPGLAYDDASGAVVGALAANSLGAYHVTVTAADPR